MMKNKSLSHSKCPDYYRFLVYPFRSIPCEKKEQKYVILYFVTIFRPLTPLRIEWQL